MTLFEANVTKSLSPACCRSSDCTIISLRDNVVMTPSRAHKAFDGLQATKLRRLPDRGQEMHTLAANLLSQQLELAPCLPRNYVLDQTKCAASARLRKW